MGKLAHASVVQPISIECIWVMVFFICRKPAVQGNPIKGYKPIQSNKFHFLNITEGGLFLGVSPHGQNLKFVGKFITEAQRLVEQHGDAPKKTHIQHICDIFEQSAGSDLNKDLLSILHWLFFNP